MNPTSTQPRPQPTPEPKPQRLTITCADGTALQAHWFAPAPTTDARWPVLIGPATGVPQRYYQRFAHWLAGQGHGVLTFDYRGIGASLQGPLAQCRATLTEWGQQDLVAALDAVLAHSGAEQALLIGHSAGGQMMGVMPNHDRLAGVLGIAASTGHFSNMRWGFRLQALFALRAAIPLAIRFKGYGPTSLFGLGEDLPAQVALDWGHWCAAGHYARNALRNPAVANFHEAVRCPITVLRATDDDIACAANVDELLTNFPAARCQHIPVHPSEHGLPGIGHIDWFRASHQALWPLMAAKLRRLA